MKHDASMRIKFSGLAQHINGTFLNLFCGILFVSSGTCASLKLITTTLSLIFGSGELGDDLLLGVYLRPLAR